MRLSARASPSAGQRWSSLMRIFLATCLLLVALPSQVDAFQLKADALYTQEVSYCSQGRAVEVERFEVRYYRVNKTIGFDLNARSIAADLNADLNVQLYAYGKSRINITINLCDVLLSALCPLPQYSFVGSFQYVLPDSLDINLPELAWTVPDLDATAVIILINQQTGNEAVCLTATLSNGKTVFLNQVRWATAGLAIGAFVVALVHSFWPLSPYRAGPEWRFATIMSYFQHVALCGFLSLDYPNVYKMFTLNFAWAQGLIYMGPVNRAINNMRFLTGGSDRLGETFNVISEDDGSDQLISTSRSFAAMPAYTAPTVQEAPTYNLISGIETTAESLGITYSNAFMTVFVVFLMFLCVMLAIILLASAGVLIYSLIKHRKAGLPNLRYFAWTNVLRVILVSYFPLVLFAFWQFLHYSDSGWLAIFIAALTFIWLHLAIAGIYWHLNKVITNGLHGSVEAVSLRWATVSQQYKRHGNYYLLVLAASFFCSAAFVAFAQGRGLVQLVPLIAIEVIVFITFCIWRPLANRWSNVLLCTISFFKIAAYAILVVFLARIHIDGIIAAVLGFVILAIQSVMVVILFFVTCFNLGVGLLWSRNSREKDFGIPGQDRAMAEKQHSRLLSNPTAGDHDPEFQPPPVSNLHVPATSSHDGSRPTTPRFSSPEMSDESRTVVGEQTSEKGKRRAPLSFWRRSRT